MMRWPQVTNDYTRIFFGAFILFWLLTTYGIPNNYPLFAATEVPLTIIDRMIPLQIWTVWIYVATYFTVGAAFLTAKERDANDMFYTLVISAAASWFFFTFLPTSIDRSLYPIPATAMGPSVDLLMHIRKVDASINCAPSMHVVMGWSVMIGTRLQKRWIHLLGIIAGLAIIYSTMSTKQHYFLDAVSGTMLASCGYFTARRLQYKQVEVRQWLSRLAS